MTYPTTKSKDHYPQQKPRKTGLMKDELGGKIMKEFVALIPKTHIYLTDNNSFNKKAKGTKKSFTKLEIKFETTRNA